LRKFAYYLILVLVIAFAALVFIATLYDALFVGTTDPGIFAPATGVQKTAFTDATRPARLFIPKLSIDAEIETVGVTKAGAVGSPSNFTNVAWYEYSPLPGQRGNAIIDGHRDNALGMDGVFEHLHELQPGDAVYVFNGEGTHVRFVVSEKERLPYDSKDTSDIFGPADGASLVLITCSGDWDKTKKQYSDRMLVYAVVDN
jgi:sortase A